MVVYSTLINYQKIEVEEKREVKEGGGEKRIKRGRKMKERKGRRLKRTERRKRKK